MSTRLEQFIKDNREDFDSDEPSPKVWDKIEDKILPEKKGAAPEVRINFMRWSAAAAVVILVTGGIWFLARTKQDTGKITNPGIAKTKPGSAAPQKQKDTSLIKNNDNAPQPQIASTNNPKRNETKKADDGLDPEANAKEELYHFAKLVEIKHKELKSIEKDEPLLYKQFSGDVNKLDSVYHSLENKLSTKQNSEELLEAMIQNLQLQMGLLNHQLRVIKQINHSKKSAYDKAYQSI